MPRFFAIHTLPNWTEEAARKGLSDSKRTYPPGVDCKLTYCAFDDHKFYCEWEAPDRGTLESVFKNLNTPFEAIYPVKLLDWKTRTLT